MRVLILFDGISCGRVALDRVGIEVDESIENLYMLLKDIIACISEDIR